MKTNRQNEGFVLTAVLMLILIASLVGGAFLLSARGTNKTVEKWEAYDGCLLAIQQELGKVNHDYYVALMDDIDANGNRRAALEVLANQDETIVVDSTLLPPSGASASSVGAASVGSSDGSVTGTIDVDSGSLFDIVMENRSEVDMVCEAELTYNGVTRRVRQTVTYAYGGWDPAGDAPVETPDAFNYAFFIDNTGYFSGVNGDFNGDVGANKDVDLKYASILLQGDAFAGGECVSKMIYKSIPWEGALNYGDQNFAGYYFGDKVRPAEYTDFDTENADTYYEQGYKGDVEYFEYQPRVEMPFMGPLADYKAYAIASGGSVSDGTKTATGVWGDVIGTEEDADFVGPGDIGSLVLIGTIDDPINIDGVVVATKDIYIKGYYTGNGTLYAGRNINVIGDVIAMDGPTWTHPDSDPKATAEVNGSKDFLGLCAKGNLIFGDYRAVEKDTAKAPFTSTHATDASDADLGYVSGYDAEGEPYFNGDYTVRDANGTGQRTDGSDRLFYEPVLGDAHYDTLGVAPRVQFIDAVVYSNHLIAGEFDGNAVLNGSFVCRDELVLRLGNLAINWDARLGSKSLDGMGFWSGLPGMMLPANRPLPSRRILWAEVPTENVSGDVVQ